MRNLVRNEKRMWYAKFVKFTQVTDVNGDYTGDPIAVYSAPVEFWATLSPGRGYSGGAGTMKQTPWGFDVETERRIMTVDTSLPIDETTIIWTDHEPDTFLDGSADPASADWSVSARPSDGINFLAIPVKARVRNGDN